jgi:glycosyltransferase involved in cell wall biosynthesis
MIVRNEADWLRGALASLRDLGPDEIIVLDTGSTDDTVEIANECGARVHSQPWRTEDRHLDFADARNAATDFCLADWVLVFDADHRLAPGSGAAIRSFVDAPTSPVAKIITHEADGIDARVTDVMSGERCASRDQGLTLLFKRCVAGETPRYELCVHESTDRWFRERGFDDRPIIDGAAIVHYGCVKSLRAKRGSDARNEALLRLRLADDPRDVSAAWYLARDLRELGRGAEALDIIDAVIARGPYDAIAYRVHLANLFSVRACILADLERRTELLGACNQIVALVGDHPAVDFYRAMAFEESDRSLARAYYWTCLTRLASADDSMMFAHLVSEWGVHARIAMTYADDGDRISAGDHFERALSFRMPAEQRQMIESEHGRLAALSLQ